MKLILNQASNNYESEDLLQFKDREVSIEELLVYCSETDCSDLYIKVNEQPYFSRFGMLIQIPCAPINSFDWQRFYDLYVSNEANAQYVREKMYDTAIEIRIPEDSKYIDKYSFFRYRASFGFSESVPICTFRMIKPDSPSFSTINYPQECIDALREAYKRKSTINVFSLPTGSGKTTTLVACMNDFTKPGEILDNKVLISLEDPIEYSFKSTRSVKFVQKELGKDFKNYTTGITQALREHPNYVNVGEARDKSVITAAIEAVRTGHGVTTSFHASTVSGTVSRMLYYLDNDINLAYDLIINLGAIFAQKLLKREDRYEVDVQYMLFNDKITRIILKAIDEGKNIQVTVNELFKDEELLAELLVKDWKYNET